MRTYGSENVYVKAYVFWRQFSLEAMSTSKSQVSVETVFRALADHTRLRLVSLLSGGEICVCFFTEVLGESQPKVSRHLAYLRRAGLVQARRDGKWMHYRLAEPADPHVRSLLDATLEMLRADPAMDRDRRKLVRICCAPKLPIQIEGAPMPKLGRSAEC